MKRLIALLCVLCMAVTLFAGCDKGGKGGTTELLWYLPGDVQPDQDAVMEKVNEILMEKLGVTLKIQFIPSSAYAERMKMTMASGAEYDICFTSNWLNDYETAVENGSLYDITEWIDEEIYEIVPEEIMEGTKIDGKIYGIPNMQIMAQPLGIWARKDLLEKYDFDLQAINHISEIEPFLEMVKNGEEGIYPFRTRWGPALWFEGKWSEIKACNYYINTETFEYKRMYDIPEYNKYLTDLRNWYKKGYIRADYASAGDDTTDSKQGKYAVQMGNYKPGQKGPDNIDMEYEFKQIVAPTISDTCGRATMNSVSYTSKNPEKAFEVIKLVNTDKELYNLLCNGIEGKHYELLENGKIVPDTNSGYCPNVDWEIGNQFNALIDHDMPDDVWEQTKAINDSAKINPFSGFTYDDTETSLDISNMIAVIDEYSDNVTVADLEAHKKEYYKALKQAGSDRVFADFEKQYDAFLKEKGLK